MFVKTTQGQLTVMAYRGDAKTLLAFDLPKSAITNLAGFTIAFRAGTSSTQFVRNSLQFADPAQHAQDADHDAHASINAPLHKFWWVHVPGTASLDGSVSYGQYSYAVTPRYFVKGKLAELDPALTATVRIKVAPFVKGAVTASFTRGFTQSQAFVNRFGANAIFRPPGNDLIFDTRQVSGTHNGEQYTFAEQYRWLGATARTVVLDLLDEVRADASLNVDVFAYDLDEPDVMSAFLDLAKAGRIRMILDNASLHHGAKKGGLPSEDLFETAFTKAAAKGAEIKRGCFARYSHDKVIVVSSGTEAGAKPLKVLTGSTNFAITGLYVNSNHVVVFDDATVAQRYADVFDASWQADASAPAFRTNPLASAPFTLTSKRVPATSITFSPHTPDDAATVLNGLVDRVNKEAGKTRASVIFAVMDLDQGSGPVFPALRALHTQTDVFSYGISDSTDGIYVYSPGNTGGVLVTGKPRKTKLPKPFNQVPAPRGHQVHHKFVVCGFNRPDAVVYCGSSNLALGGEQDNGDNLLAIQDQDLATVFAIDGMALVDHFDFLDKTSSPSPASSRTPAPGHPDDWVLTTTGAWAAKYFDPKDQHYATRRVLIV